MTADRPPGREREGGPAVTPSRPRHAAFTAAAGQQQGSTAASVSRGAVSGRAPRGAAELLALSDERDKWLRRVLDAWREGYQAALSDAVVESLLRIFPEPGHVSDLEKRRYPPDGREHFGKPRVGEYAGGPVKWEGGNRR
jgi:hypothetical protein